MRTSRAVVGVALMVVVGGALAFVEPWRIPREDPYLGAAVEPSLSVGDLVLVARKRGVKRADLVRCPHPEVPGRYVVGRALAFAGEAVSFQGEVVSVDGKYIPSARACPARRVKSPATDFEVDELCSEEELAGRSYRVLRGRDQLELSLGFARVDPGRVFLVSDNRHLHLDSRDFGTVAKNECQHVVFRMWGGAGILDGERRFDVIW